jgi:predicted PurR-regulated permease PerM
MESHRADVSAALRKGAAFARDAEVRSLRVVVLLGLGVTAAVLIGTMLWPFLPALVTSGVLGVVALPSHRWIRSRIRQDEIAAILSTLAVVVVILLPIFGLSLMALQDLSNAVEWLEGQVRMGFPLVDQILVRVEGILTAMGLGGFDFAGSIRDQIGGVSDLVVGRTFRVVSGLGGLALQAGVCLFTLFYLFRDVDRVVQAARRLVPLASGPTELLAGRAKEVIFAAVFGHVFVAAVQGILGGMAFWALGVPAPVAWGALMACLALIPMVGPAFVYIPASFVLIGMDQELKGVILLTFGFVVISTVDNVIRSVLVSDRARVHPLVVFFGVLGGVFAFGAVGILVGPVLIVVAGALMEMTRLSLFPDESGPAVVAAPQIPETFQPSS